jgi:hypothetical protein
MFLGSLANSLFSEEVKQKASSRKTSARRRLGGLPAVDLMSNLVWIAPIRSKPQRTYDELRKEYSPEGEHTPYVLKKLLSSRRQATAFKTFLQDFGRSSGLFDEVLIHKFGREGESPFELEIKLGDASLNINNVGYGVSQALPILVEFFNRNKGTFFAIQQPEVHLHPRAQAELGELIFNFAAEDSKCFLVETHSDYLIDRYRVSVANSVQGHIPKAQVLFFCRKEGFNRVFPIEITETGKLSEAQPKEYRDFFVKENLSILKAL